MFGGIQLNYITYPGNVWELHFLEFQNLEVNELKNNSLPHWNHVGKYDG